MSQNTRGNDTSSQRREIELGLWVQLPGFWVERDERATAFEGVVSGVGKVVGWERVDTMAATQRD